jgi:hypothetical protein
MPVIQYQKAPNNDPNRSKISVGFILKFGLIAAGIGFAMWTNYQIKQDEAKNPAPAPNQTSAPSQTPVPPDKNVRP